MRNRAGWQTARARRAEGRGAEGNRRHLQEDDSHVEEGRTGIDARREENAAQLVQYSREE